LSLIEDPSMIYRLSALGGSGRLHLWASKDGETWEKKSFPAPFQGSRTTVHRTQLFSLPEGRLLLLASDNLTGLQYARFYPGGEEPTFDLAARVRLQPYAAAALPDGRFAAAFKEDDRIDVHLYSTFGAGDPQQDERSTPLYVETGRDARGAPGSTFSPGPASSSRT